MKTLKLVAVLLILSLHANASGYAHNMFVAHKKLQTGKEMHVTKAKPVRHIRTEKAIVKPALVTKPNQSAVQHFASRFSGMVTLNERILAEGSTALFLTVKEEQAENTVVSRLVGAVKMVVYAFIAPSLRG